MKKTFTACLLLAASLGASAQVTPLSQMERLDRGVVAMPPRNATGVFLTWRLLGTDERTATTFDVLRNGEPIATGLTVTCYTDPEGVPSNEYQVVTRVGGEVTETSAVAPYWEKAVKTLQLQRPSQGAQGGTYTPNDMSVGDVDGDGQYELIVKWDPSNSKDNSQKGKTDKVLLDCYRLDGTHLWRIDLGQNIRAGAHYTQFLVYDFDGDGRAELICKTAPGSKDGEGNYVNQAATDAAIQGHSNTSSYANSNGYVNDGPEYLTVFSGLTGKALHTIWYLPNRAGNFKRTDAHPSSSYWGDSYGGRCDRFLAAVAYLDGPDQHPSGIFSRGYYTRAFVWAVDFDGEQLHTKWLHDSESRNYVNLYIGDDLEKQARKAYTKCTSGAKSSDSESGIAGSCTMFGNGNHNLSVADVDGDGCDEILWGSGAVNNDGTLLYAVGYGHGDAIHVGKMIPDREGLQVFDVHEEKLNATHGSWDLHDAATGEVIHHGGSAGKDNGRGMAADLTANNRGYEFWSSDERNPRSAETGKTVISESCSVNFRIYWDGDAQDELFDGSYDSSNAKANPYIQKWNGSSFTTLRSFGSNDNNPQTCNTTKATPCLQADLYGDWREELIMWNLNDPSQVMIFTSNIATDHAVPTLMHDHVYRMGVAWQNTAYNQPPHLGYYLPDYIDGKLPDNVSAPSAATTGRSLIYDLQGRRHDTLQPGLNIVRTQSANGVRVRKVMK